jgi:hypothetical protein
MKLTTLKKLVFVRGETCATCTTKADWAQRAAEVSAKPVQAHLEEEWQTEQEYRKKLKAFNMTRTEFVEQMNASENGTLSEGRHVDRLWESFQRQLADGRVEFVDDGSVRFSMPLTHRIAPYVHPRLAVRYVRSEPAPAPRNSNKYCIPPGSLMCGRPGS